MSGPPPPPAGQGLKPPSQTRIVIPPRRGAAPPTAPAMGTNFLDTATLGDIATRASGSNVFYLAACQPLVNALKYADEKGSQHWHTYHFKNMVATILLETKGRAPSEKYARHHREAMALPILVFNRMTKSGQLTLLQNLWGDCYEKVTPSTVASAMCDGELTVDGKMGLPSSIKRIAGTSFHTMITVGTKPHAWSEYQIGFRIDGGKAVSGGRDDLARIVKEGMVGLQKRPDLAVMVVKKFYHEHPCSMNSDLYIVSENRDLYNESGTCVARSLFGATAFPERETHNAWAGGEPGKGGELAFQYLFAVDCAGAQGVDTETIQKQKGKNSLWRPGEKAFPGISADRVLGWTRIVRKGKGTKSPNVFQNGWSFQFVDSKWTWIKAPGVERQAYLEAELAEWQPGTTYTIPDQFDFQTNSGSEKKD